MLEKQEVMINVVQFSQIYILHHHFGKKGKFGGKIVAHSSLI